MRGDYRIKVALNLAGEPEHWLVKEGRGKGSIRTRCGLADYRDGVGKGRRGVRDGRTVGLLCQFCQWHLRSAIEAVVKVDQGGLFDE